MNLTEILTPEVFQRYRQHLKAQKIPSATITRKLSSLRRFQSWAENRFLKKIPSEILQTGSKPVIEAYQPSSKLIISKSKTRWLLYPFISLIVSLIVFLLLSPDKLSLLQSFLSTQPTIKEFLPSDQSPTAQLAQTPSNQQAWIITFQAEFADLANPTSASFKLYNQAAGGASLWTSKTWSLTPDQTGLYSLALGDAAQTDNPIPTNLFFQNQDLFLEASVDNQILTPRFRVSTAANAANAFLLQQYPPESPTGPLTIPILNNNGSLILAAAAPKVAASNGTLAIEGQAITLQTLFASDGDIILAPDGAGNLQLNLSNTSDNSFSLTNANLNQDSLIYAYLGNDNTNPYLLRLTAGSSEADIFTVKADGTTNLHGSLAIEGSLSDISDTSLTINDDLSVTGGDITGANSASLDIGETNADYLISSVGLAVGNATTYYFDKSGNFKANDANFADDVVIEDDLETKGQATLGDGGETITLNGSVIYFDDTNLTSNITLTASDTAFTSGDTAIIDAINSAYSSSSLWTLTSTTLHPTTTTTDLAVGGTDGTAPFYVNDSGDLTATGTTTLNSLTYTWPASQTADYVLQTNGTGTLSWIDNSSLGTNYWDQQNGTLYPFNSTVDLLIGGQASSSANFAFINNNDGTPTASISGNLILNAAGLIQTTNNQLLTIGGNTTGDIYINDNVGIGTSTPGSPLEVKYSSANTSTTTPALTLNNPSGGSQTVQYFETNGTKRASLRADSSGNFIVSASGGDLYFGNDGTQNNIHIYAGGTEKLTVSSSGYLGILETSPISQLSIGAGSHTAVTDGTTATSVFGLNLSITDDAAYAAGIYNSNVDGDGLLIQAGDASDDYALRVEDFDSANDLFVVRGDGNVAIGEAAPDAKLEILAATEQLRLTETEDTNYLSFTVANDGGSTLAATGADADITINPAGDFILSDLNCTTNDNDGALTADANGVISCTDDDGAGAAGMWQENTGAISPINNTWDVLIGSTASSSADFAFLNVADGVPTASFSGNLVLNSAGVLSTTNQQLLTIGDADTGDIELAPDGSTALTIQTGGNVGLNTTNPSVQFHMNIDGGTVPALDSDTYFLLNNSSAAGDHAMLSIITGTSGTASLALGDSAAEGQGLIWYDNAVDAMYFRTAGSSAELTIEAGGEIGIGDPTPDSPLEIFSTTIPQLRLTYDDTVDEVTFGIDDSGLLTITPTGADTDIIGTLYLNDTSNASMTQGITINQGANDDEILALKSSDVTHGMTGQAETDTYLKVGKISGDDGGAYFNGLRDTGDVALALRGYGVTDDTGKTTSDRGYVELVGAKKNTTTIQDVGADGNILAIRNNTTTKLIVDAEGTIHQIPGSDIDVDLLTVQVTGTPTLFWDQTEGAHTFSNDLNIQGTSIGFDNDNDVNNTLAFAAAVGIASGDLYWGNDILCDVSELNCGGGSGSSYWDITDGAIHPANEYASVADVLIGGTSTTSADFAFIHVDSGTPTASISGNIVLNAAGIISTTAKQTLTLGDASTGNLAINLGLIDLSNQTIDVTLNNAADALNFDSNTLSIDASGDKVGIGTAAPEALLEIQGAQETDAILALDADEGDDDNDTWFIESEADNDLSFVQHTTERAKIDTNGYLYAERFSDITDSAYYIDPAATPISINVLGDAVIGDDVYVSGGEIFLTGITASSSTTEGTIFYDSDSAESSATNHLFVYGSDTAWHRIALDMTKYTASNASLANQSYIEIAHNQTTNDIAATAWFYDTITSLWKSITEALAKLIDHDLDNEFNPEFTQKQKVTTVTLDKDQDSLGDGADGAISVSSDTIINDTSLISGRNCSDGGDAVNYNVTILTSTTATVDGVGPASGCLDPGDEVLLINLMGSNSAFVNVGNWETLEVQGVSSNVVTFASGKTKNYGSGASDDNDLGTADGTQRVMLQRVPNYTSVTITGTDTDFYADDYGNGPKGGVMFFRATGAVSVGSDALIHTNYLGYEGGDAIGGGTHPGGEGGSAFCGAGGDGGTNGNGGDGAAGGGGGDTPNNGGIGYCGGGGGAYSGTGGDGSDNQGGAGGGGAIYGGGGGGGYGTFGYGDGNNGGTNASGDGETNHGGGGGGTYGDANLTDLFLGSGGGRGGDNSGQGGTSGSGGDGGGIIYISADSITVSGGIESNGANGGNMTVDYSGGGGGGSGGSIKLLGNALIIGTDLVDADNGTGGTGYSGGNGGAGGDGRTAIGYSNSLTGSTSTPSSVSITMNYNPYAVYVSEEIHTPGTTAFNTISWTETLDTYGELQLQTRSGATADSTDGTWEAWKTATLSATLDNANTHTDWSSTHMTVSEGDVARNIDYFEDEDEDNSGNLTKIATTSAQGYTQKTISSTDLTDYHYISFWMRSSSAGQVAEISFGESTYNEQTASISADLINSWQKVYWDITDVAAADKNAVTKLGFTLTSPVTIWFDDIKAETYHTDNGDDIQSTANDYLQYRAILSTTDGDNAPTLSAVQVNLTNPNGTYTIDADSIIDPNQAIKNQTSRRIDPETLDYVLYDTGDGGDGAISVTSDTIITDNISISGRTCSDGGDAVNYSITTLTSTTATLDGAGPSTGCLVAGDEVLIINLQGTNSAMGNVGNWETLDVQSVSGDVVTFASAKTKYYGDGAIDDSNLGTATGTQRVMLQRVPNYTSVSVTGVGTDFYADDWGNSSGPKGGVMFFRSTGAVNIGADAKIHTNYLGYDGGDTQGTGTHPGGEGGEAFCGPGGAGGAGADGFDGAAGGGASYTTPNSIGGDGYCGGGGGGSGGGGGDGSDTQGGAGGGGGYAYGGGGGGGYGTFGYGGGTGGEDGGTNQSGDGQTTYGGGGGGTYGDANLTDLFMGSAGGRGGDNSVQGGTAGSGGDGGGIIYISADSITVSGGIESNGANGGNMTVNYSGGGGGGSGGSIKLLGNALTIGTDLVDADGGTGGTGYTGGFDGGNAGDGRIAVYYASSISGSTSTPSYVIDTLSEEYNPYEVWISNEINTAGAVSFTNIAWTEDLDTNGMIEIQTRSGNTSNSTDGTWEDWKPSTVTTNYVDLRDMDNETSEGNWTETDLNNPVDGDITRNVDYYEDEDESTVGNITKFGSVGSPNGYAEASVPQAGGSIDLTGFDYITTWLYATAAGQIVELGFGEDVGNEATTSATIESANTWQKVYWDITDLTASDCTGADGCNAVDIFRISLTAPNTTLYVDSIKAEKDLLETAAGSSITSTVNNYLQYRAILTTTNIFNTPTLSEVRITYNDGSAQTINDRLSNQNDTDQFDNHTRLSIATVDLDDYKSIDLQKLETGVTMDGAYNPGTGADGDVTVSSDTTINNTNLISGRSCTDGGDAVNYNVTTLTSRTAALNQAPSTDCLAVGDEVLLINLQGANAAMNNVGNYETLIIENIADNVVTFTTAKAKYYGDGGSDDTNLGIVAGTQRVMLQRVPNYNNVTINDGIYFYSDDFGSIGPKGGVMFFKAKGHVAVNGYIYTSGYGYDGGDTYGASGVDRGGEGGSSFCGPGGAGGIMDGAGQDGAAGGGGANNNGGDGYCGGGGAGDSGGLGGDGSDTRGGAGGGGAPIGGGGGGGYGTLGYGGAGYQALAARKGEDGGTNSSGDGGNDESSGSYGGGGGGGTYGDANLTKLFMGSGGARGGYYNSGGGLGGIGGDGGGIIYVSADSITISGGIYSDGGYGTSQTAGNGTGGGGASGGSIKLIADEVNLGPTFVTASAGSAGSGAASGAAGGAGGSGRIAIFYGSSISGSSSPTAQVAEVPMYPHSILVSDEIPTPDATQYTRLTWRADNTSYGIIQAQTRSGTSNNSTDGTWEAWKPVTDGTNYTTLESADTHTNWTASESTLVVTEGGVARDVNFFEDEDESTTTNMTKLEVGTNSNTYAEARIVSTDLTDYDFITAWLYATTSGNVIKLGFGETDSDEHQALFELDSASVWQKVYWDISHIPDHERDGIRNLRITIPTNGTEVYFDNLEAERLMNDSSGSTITSTPDEYIQYRFILATSEPGTTPTLYNAQVEWSNGYKVEHTDTDTIRLYNFTGETQNVRLDAIVFGADLAEWYPTDDQSIEAGDVVRIAATKDEYGVPKIAKTSKYADTGSIGIISTRAGKELGLPRETSRLVGLQGRVPTKIAPDSPAVQPGDILTSSSTHPGMATKLVSPGQAIGKSLDYWQPGSDKDKIDVFINISYFDPFDTASLFNNVHLELFAHRLYSLYSLAADITGDYSKAYFDRAGAYSKLLAANLKAGFIDAQEIVTNTLTADTKIITPTVETETLTTNFISPLSDDQITITGPVIIEAQPATDSASPTPLALEVRGSASISGDLVANRLVTNELIANKVKASTIEGLRSKIEDIVANLDQPTVTPPDSQSIDVNTLNTISQLLESYQATDSATHLNLASVNADFGFFSDYLAVMGTATITNLKVTNTLSINNQLILASNSISTLDDTLYLQPSGHGAINFLAGLMTLDSTGQATINGDLEVTGTLAANTGRFNQLVLNSPDTPSGFAKLLDIQNQQGQTLASIDSSGSAQFKQLQTEGLIIANADTQAPTASTSASITTNATAGQATLPQGLTEFTINTPHVTNQALVYVTPIGDPQNQVLFVKAKKAQEWFKVAINQPLPYDLPFNWWIIKLD